MFFRTLHFIVLSLQILILTGILDPRKTHADNRYVITPFAGFEGGGASFGGNIRDFFLPNLGGEIDGGVGESLCQDCSLSETTLTANIVYEIHPLPRLSFYLLCGGGVGFFNLSAPESQQISLGLFDAALGMGLRLIKNVGLTLENRWFVPLSGGFSGISGNLSSDRLSLGLSTSF